MREETENIYRVDASTGVVQVDGTPISFTETADMEVNRFHATVGLSVRF